MLLVTLKAAEDEFNLFVEENSFLFFSLLYLLVFLPFISNEERRTQEGANEYQLTWD